MSALGRRALVVVLLLAGCRIDALDLEGKPCPCPAGYFCHPKDGGDYCATTEDLTHPFVAPPDLSLSEDEWLTGLSFSSGQLSPAFSPEVTSYTLLIPVGTVSLTVTPTVGDGVLALIDDVLTNSGEASAAIDVRAGVVPISIQVSTPAAKRTYTVSARHAAYLKPEIAGNDQFGAAVAFDGTTLVVGAPAECSDAITVDGDESDTSTCGNGAVFVFVRSGASWVQQAYLKAPQTSTSFGAAVAISGDTAVVSAPGEAVVYLFTRVGPTWLPPTAIPDPGSSDGFGAAIALSGDTLVIGAPTSNGAVGTAYVYANAAGNVMQTAQLLPSPATGFREFGQALALVGDTLVVGAPWDSAASASDPSDTSVLFAGAAYVFTESSGTWAQTAYLKASTTAELAYFGQALAFDGSTLVVGAPGYEDAGGSLAGAAYVFAASAGTFTLTTVLAGSDPSGTDDFGGAVALSGNLIAVGATGEASSSTGIDGAEVPQSATGAGAAYLFGQTSGQWSQTRYVKALNTAAGDAFGGSVALGGGVLLVGAPDETSSGTGVDGDLNDRINADQVGAVYAYPLQ